MGTKAQLSVKEKSNIISCEVNENRDGTILLEKNKKWGQNDQAKKKGLHCLNTTPLIYLAGETGFEPIFTESEF